MQRNCYKEYCTWKNHLPDHQELQGERFDCSEEVFRTSQGVQQASGCLLLKSQLRNSVSTSAELAQEWQQLGVRASARTVKPRLLDKGLVSRRAAKKPLLSKKSVKDRLKFCRKYKDWTAEDWCKVIFSDEAPFQPVSYTHLTLPTTWPV